MFPVGTQNNAPIRRVARHGGIQLRQLPNAAVAYIPSASLSLRTLIIHSETTAIMSIYLILAGLLIVAFIGRRISKNIRRRRAAKQLNCQPVTRRQNRLPFGFDFIQEIAAADKADAVPIHFEDVAKKMAPATTWQMDLFGKTSMMTIEPNNVKALLATQFKDFDLGPRRKGCFSPMFAHGIFSDDGERWERSRALIRPSFAREQLANVEVLERHVQVLMRRLDAGDVRTQHVDLKPLFFCFTLDSSTELLFGQSVDSQAAALATESKTSNTISQDYEWQNFGPAFDKATEQISKRFRLDAMYWLYDTKELRSACAEVHRFADHFVQLALQQTTASYKDVEASAAGNTTKQPYVFLHELAKSTRDPTELRDQLLNVLLAGRDTTAGLLGFTWYQLARNPAIHAKLRNTIISEFGTYSRPKNLDFASLKACTYLQHTLNEALRLHPAVPVNARRAVRDTTLPHGGGPDGLAPIFVPKGTEVNYSVHAMQRRKDLWGSDADEFKPERWVGRKPGWEFLPFNGGPRICLGQQSALTTAGYVTVRLLQRFEELNDLVPHVEAKVRFDGDKKEEKWGGADRERYWTAVTDAPVHVKVRLREAMTEK